MVGRDSLWSISCKGEKVYKKLLDKLEASWNSQPDKPEETPESTLRALYFAAAGNPLSAGKAASVPLPGLDKKSEKKLISLVERRCNGIPLAYITGRQQFMGLEMLVSPAAMIPREETLVLGNEALSIARSLSQKRGDLTLLDVCSGSGNVILGIMAHEQNTRGFGSDLSYEAVELARMNASHLGLEERIEFRQGDLFQPFKTEDFLGRIDIITCNPPYISSKNVPKLHPEISDHEPHMAFDGGPYGLNILTRLIRESPVFLKSSSFLCFEVGLGQGEFIKRKLKNSNQFREIRPLKDNAHQIRAFTAQT